MFKKEEIDAFLEAAVNGDMQGLQRGIYQEVDINCSNSKGQTAVTLACLNRHYECVSMLIGAGADIDLQDETCFNPFLISCLTGDMQLLQLVLPAGPDLKRVTRFGGVGLTPACEKGHVEIVRELLTRTAINVNQTNFLGWTPLLEAIVLNDGGERQQEIIRLLLAHGANPHMTDKYGKTPLELAQTMGFTAIADLLIAAGAQQGGRNE